VPRLWLHHRLWLTSFLFAELNIQIQIGHAASIFYAQAVVTLAAASYTPPPGAAELVDDRGEVARAHLHPELVLHEEPERHLLLDATLTW
jgi:hypothetical protein